MSTKKSYSPEFLEVSPAERGNVVFPMLDEVRAMISATPTKSKTLLMALLITGGFIGSQSYEAIATPADIGRLATTISTLAASGDLAAMDLEFWASIKDAQDAESYQAYLESFPNGKFAPLARVRVKKYGGVQPQVAPLYSHHPQPAGTQTGAQTATRAIKIVPSSHSVPTPPAPPNTVADLMRRAHAARSRNRLTSPSSDNAVKWAEQVLAVQPGNREAYSLLNGVVATYLAWSRNGLNKGTFNKAEANLGKARRIKHYASSAQLDEMQRLGEQIAAGKQRAAQVASLGPQHQGVPATRSLGVAPSAAEVGSAPPVASEPSLERWVESLNSMDFVRIRGGCFAMGSPPDERGRFNSEASHRVCVEPFWMATKEVTNAQYRLYDPSHSSADHEGLSLDGDDQPVVFVTWADAYKYAKWLSDKTGKKFRLPTEAEWEYAARAGSETARFWGEESKLACTYANAQDKVASTTFDWHWPHHQCSDGYAVSAPVGQFTANRFGLHDMLGNVWEWTCSAWSEAYDGSEKTCETNIWAPTSRAVRGGSWVNVPRNVRSAFRQGRPPAISKLEIGFRLVKEGG